MPHEHEHESSADPRRRRGRGGPRRGGPFGRPGGWQQGDLPDASDAAGWFAGRIPDDWFTGDLRVTVDRDEITVIGELPAPDSDEPAAAEGRITRWREDSRGLRMKIADEAQAKYGRSVAWGARIGETGQLFTHLAVPAMTRLRQSERQVLDTLVDSGVARSRSEALAWCVRLVGQHSDEWLNGLRGAMSEVERLRAEGPSV
ncbi:MAG: hypothetical protein QOE58_2219 [Actinomycetota bacterium]|jgi:hypothetical protein|nr:hypothetical protein [Actinomycetota bacterium]